MLSAPWARRRDGRVIAGVCLGLAEQFGISVTIVRLAFALGALLSGGVAVLLYIALWLAMPLEPESYAGEGHGFEGVDDSRRPPSLPRS
ncbi:MAG: PspC domain-containing protein [Deltaproteobacteria bacterium]|nr:PspC domain-containing protein [Deltaproteobacteria bacterium]